MARPDTVLRSINEAIRQSGNLPAETSYITTTADSEGEHANLRMPIVETSTASMLRNRAFNTDLVGYVTDDAGNRTGHVFHTRFEMLATVNVYTADGGPYDHKELGYQVRQALYQYDDAGPGLRSAPRFLPDPDSGNPLYDIKQFTVDDAQPNPDYTMSPTLRRWQIDVNLLFVDEVRTTEPTITVVHCPEDGEFTSGDGVQIEYDASKYIN